MFIDMAMVAFPNSFLALAFVSPFRSSAQLWCVLM